MRKLALTTTALAMIACLVPASALAAKTVTPAFAFFDPTPFGSQTASKTVTVGIGASDTDRTTAPYIAPCHSTGGPASCDFVITANTCPSSFGGGAQTCNISVAFRPFDNPNDQTVDPGQFASLEIGPFFPSVALRGTELRPAPSKPKADGKGKRRKCGKKKGKGKRSASAAKKKKKCGKKKK